MNVYYFSRYSQTRLPLYSDSAAPFGRVGAALSVRASFPEGRPPPCLRRFLSISPSKEHFQKAPSPTSPTTHDDQEDISRSQTFHVMLLTSKQCRIGCRLTHQCVSSLGHVMYCNYHLVRETSLPSMISFILNFSEMNGTQKSAHSFSLYTLLLQSVKPLKLGNVRKKLGSIHLPFKPPEAPTPEQISTILMLKCSLVCGSL